MMNGGLVVHGDSKVAQRRLQSRVSVSIVDTHWWHFLSCNATRCARHLVKSSQRVFAILFFVFTTELDGVAAGETATPIKNDVRSAEIKPIVSDEVHDVYVNTPGSVQFLHVNLKPLRAGEKRAVIVNLHNNLPDDGTVTFEEVDSHCKCTSTQVPAVSLLSGKSEKLAFIFDVEARPSLPRHVYAVTIKTSGAAKVIELRFAGEYENYVGFAQRTVTQRFSENAREFKFPVPLVVSSNVDLTSSTHGLAIEKSDHLVVLEPRLETTQGRLVLTCSVDRKDKRIDGVTTGYLRLVRGGQVLDEMVLSLAPYPDVRVIPDKIIFIPQGDGKTQYVGTALLKFDPASFTENPTIRKIECFASEGSKFDVRWESLAHGTFRITVSIVDASSSDASPKMMRLKVETEARDVFELNVESSFISS